MAKRSKTRMSPSDAETLALQILGFLAEDGPRLSRFLNSTGVRPEELQSNAGEPAMLLAVTQHLLEDESLLLVFASHSGIAPEQVGQAHRLLGDQS